MNGFLFFTHPDSFAAESSLSTRREGVNIQTKKLLVPKRMSK